LSERHAIVNLVAPGDFEAEAALIHLAEALGSPASPSPPPGKARARVAPALPSGQLTAQAACAVLAALQPENAIIIDEAVTSGGAYFELAATAPPHSLLTLTGGSLGFGMPCAAGAALACPDRPVINLQADGSAMYTIQSLWMQAREGLDITTLLCANNRYEIIRMEMARAGGDLSGLSAVQLTSLDRPGIDWVGLSKGMGVPAVAVDSAEGLARQLQVALAEPGPHLIAMHMAL
jgi:acetolactate synthase-1/2/3 large subunit